MITGTFSNYVTVEAEDEHEAEGIASGELRKDARDIIEIDYIENVEVYEHEAEGGEDNK